MARKSNKTAHVLNLLAGHEDKEKKETTAAGEESTGSTEPDKAAPETESTTVEAKEEKPAAPQNISVIDRTEEDSLAQLIQDKLSDEFEKEISKDAAATQETVQEEEPVLQEKTVLEAPQEETASLAVEPILESAQEEAAQEAAPQEDMTSQIEETPQEKTPQEEAPQEEVTSQAAEPVQKSPQEIVPEEEPQEEPDFVVVNLMERIVRDKIIYFMRQFDVCTCDRCIADTTALTLNGLAPKYIVTMPAAVDPLLSLYTNKFISDITVEATKACIIIKENPRH